MSIVGVFLWEPPGWKNISLVQLDHFPKKTGWTYKNTWNQHLDSTMGPISEKKLWKLSNSTLQKWSQSSSSLFAVIFGKKKPHLLLHQKTKMICDLFLCLQLGLWWNAGIGTWGWRNAKQKTTQRLDAVLAVTNPFLTAETPIDFLLYFLVLGVFFYIILYPNCHSEEPRVVRKNALCSVHRSNSNERRWFVLSVEPMAQALGRHGPHGPIRRHDSQRIGKHQIHL